MMRALTNHRRGYYDPKGDAIGAEPPAWRPRTPETDELLERLREIHPRGDERPADEAQP